MDPDTAFLAIVAYFVFLFSTVCHEAAHALAARLLGDPTAYHNGQVSLSPFPHIQQEPLGLGLLPVVSLLIAMQGRSFGVFGYASAPFDPLWALRNPRRAGVMAMAGPAANFLLVLLAGLGMKAGIAAQAFRFGESSSFWRIVEGSGTADGAAVLLSVFFSQNLMLGLWNLLPVPPMDGFSMLLFVLPQRSAAWFFETRQTLGMFFPMAMFGLSTVFWPWFAKLWTAAVIALIV